MKKMIVKTYMDSIWMDDTERPPDVPVDKQFEIGIAQLAQIGYRLHSWQFQEIDETPEHCGVRTIIAVFKLIKPTKKKDPAP